MSFVLMRVIVCEGRRGPQRRIRQKFVVAQLRTPDLKARSSHWEAGANPAFSISISFHPPLESRTEWFGHKMAECITRKTGHQTTTNPISKPSKLALFQVIAQRRCNFNKTLSRRMVRRRDHHRHALVAAFADF